MSAPITTRFATRDLTLERSVLYATLVVGVLDAGDGIVFFGLQGKSPIQVLQYIASSVLGSQSFSDGLASAGLGLVLHFTVALVVAGIYILASQRIALLCTRWVLGGLLYGAAVWAFMNLVFLPQTAVAHNPIAPAAWINGIIGHALFVGLPCAFFACKMQADRPAAT